MKRGAISVVRGAGMAAALLLAAGWTATPVLAQSGSASPGSGVSRGLVGSTYQGQIGDEQAAAAGLPEQLSRVPDGVSDLAVQDDVTAELEELGFTDIGDIRLGEGLYAATAEWGGDPLALTVELDSGDISYYRQTAAATDAPEAVVATPPAVIAVDAATGEQMELPSQIYEFPSDSGRTFGEEDITAELQELGFTDIANTRLSGDIYEADAQWQGRAVALSVEGETGAISYGDIENAAIHQPANLSEAAAIPTPTGGADSMDADYVRGQLQAMGFTDVQDINESGDIFETAARWNGEWVQLRIDGNSGGVDVE